LHSLWSMLFCCIMQNLKEYSDSGILLHLILLCEIAAVSLFPAIYHYFSQDIVTLLICFLICLCVCPLSFRWAGLILIVCYAFAYPDHLEWSKSKVSEDQFSVKVWEGSNLPQGTADACLDARRGSIAGAREKITANVLPPVFKSSEELIALVEFRIVRNNGIMIVLLLMVLTLPNICRYPTFAIWSIFSGEYISNWRLPLALYHHT